MSDNKLTPEQQAAFIKGRQLGMSNMHRLQLEYEKVQSYRPLRRWITKLIWRIRG